MNELRTGTFSKFEGLSFSLLMGLLAWSLVPFGSNRAWAEAFFGLLVFGLLALTLISRIWQPQRSFTNLLVVSKIGWLFSIWILWISIQLIPLPNELLKWLSPHAHAIQYLAQAPENWVALSLDRDASLMMCLRVTTVAALVTLLFIFMNSEKRLFVFAIALVLCGVLEALIGLGIYWSGAVDPTVQVSSRDTIGPVGTFISRNHFAGFMEMALAMNTGLILIKFKSQGFATDWRSWVRNTSDLMLSLRGFLLLAQLLMFAALILSGSRGGVFAFLIAVTVVGVGLSLQRGKATVLSWFPIVLAGAGAIFWFGGGAFLNRISTLGLANNRLELAEVSLRIIADYPITGSGAGTFRWIFPLYKDVRFGGLFYEHAHNDFLEIAIEQGIVGLLIFLTLVGVMLFKNYRTYCDRQNRLARSVSLGAMIAGVSILSHSMVDFNLQIPANFYWFFAILTAGACAGQIERRGGAHSHGSI